MPQADDGAEEARSYQPQVPHSNPCLFPKGCRSFLFFDLELLLLDKMLFKVPSDRYS